VLGAVAGTSLEPEVARRAAIGIGAVLLLSLLLAAFRAVRSASAFGHGVGRRVMDTGPAPILRALVLLALLAALVPLWAGAEGRDSARSMRAAALRARGPPPLAQADLTVQRCGQDPFANRSWLVGASAGGPGILCSWPGRLPDGVGAGAVVRVHGRVSVPRRPTNPGETDRAQALARGGIALRLYLGEIDNLEVRRPGGSVAARALRRARRAGADRLIRTLAPDDAGLATALVFGWRHGISPRDRLRFERTGTLHLLAISGLHLLLVAGAVHAFARRLGVGPRAAAAVTLAVCLLYVPVAGAGTPVRRAATVLLIYGVALARGRMPDAAGALGGAALILVLRDPEEVRRIGFWLSFVAAVGIALHAGPWRRAWGARHRLLARFPAVQEDRKWRIRIERHLLAAVPVSVAAWCATAPLIAGEFGYVTPWAPLTNLVAAPFVTVLMPLCGLVASGFEPAAPFVRALFAALRASLDAFDACPATCVTVAPPASLAVAAWYGGFLVLRGRPRIGVAAMALCLLFAWPGRAPGPPSMTVLDVGHGQAVLVLDRRGRAALVDAGSRNRLRVGRRILQPALREAGASRLELAVCTHADRDHWSGLRELIGRIPIAALAVGPDEPDQLIRAAAASGSRIVRARSGDLLWAGDGVSIRVLDDGRAQTDASPNDRSLALVVILDGTRVLLPADREEAGIRALLRQEFPPCDALLAPHHGARNEAMARLGAHVRPRLLLVSTGPGFADRATLDAARAERILRTDVDGAIRLEASRDGPLRVRPVLGDTIRPP
jgi:competence protein ComEC